MNLFRLGDFALRSGLRSGWKIDCDGLTPDDWAALAVMASEVLPPFSEVSGVPRGGLPFADAMREYATTRASALLICEDVVTTGGSMERWRKVIVDDPQTLLPNRIIGVAAFARGPCPDWVTPLFPLARRVA